MTEQYKKCPYCGEEILFDAIKCKHCGEFLSEKPKKEKETVIIDKRSGTIGESASGVAKTAIGVGIGGCLTPIFIIIGIMILCWIIGISLK